MKKGYWIAAVMTLAFVGFGLSAFQKTLTPYVSFDEARKSRGVVQVMGSLDKASDQYDTATQELRFDLLDPAGNRSPTNTVSFSYVVTARMGVETNGLGKVSPNYNGQQLELGKSYKITDCVDCHGYNGAHHKDHATKTSNCSNSHSSKTSSARISTRSKRPAPSSGSRRISA